MAEPQVKQAADDETEHAGGRVLKLLQCVAEGEREFALKDLVARTGLAPSTTHRLLGFLVQADMVERAGPKAYRLGPEIFRIASLILQKFDLHKLARPLLHELWTQWQETCSFCLYKPSTRSAVVVETIRTPHPLQFVVEPHTEISLAWGSMGRSILAHLPAEDVDAVLALDRRGPISGKRLPTRRNMRQDLERIRQHGYAVYEDKELDIAGVTAPVFGPGGSVVGCIGVTMPASRFRKPDESELCQAVVNKARRLSAASGFGGS
ncbi:MAG: IclR family transcriptional regulator [Steroidobacteraceae bacterium]